MKIFFSFLPSQHSFCSKFPKIIYTIFLHLDRTDYSKKGVEKQNLYGICIYTGLRVSLQVWALYLHYIAYTIIHIPHPVWSSSGVKWTSPVSRAEPSQASQPINNRGPRQLHELSSVPRVHTFRGNCVKLRKFSRLEAKSGANCSNEGDDPRARIEVARPNWCRQNLPLSFKRAPRCEGEIEAGNFLMI